MIRLGIDAANFVQDRRGMGRFACPIVRAALDDPRFTITFLARRRDARALRLQFGDRVSVRNPSSAARRNAYDIVWFPFNGARWTCASRSLVTIYDAFAFSEPAKGFVARWREQAPIRRAAARATISQWSAHQIATILRVDPSRIVVVHPAPDPYFFPAPGDTLPPNLQDKQFVLFVAGPERRKNAQLLIEACAKALRAPGETLAVIGNLSEQDEEYLRAYAPPHVRLRADDGLLRTLYRTAALVAVPSRGEGFGLVAIEAMACGAPVIASNVSALPEATGGDALLLDSRDTAAWAKAIRMLLDDSAQRSALAARAAARYAFADRTKPIRNMLALLQETAEAKASAAS
jgi:glycosyltransferase involved in cell wall biosynthesis